MFKKQFFLILICGLLFWPLLSKAAFKCVGNTNCVASNESACKAISGCQWMEASAYTPSDSANCSTGACRLNNPLNPNNITTGTQIDTPQKFIGVVINSILGLVGSIALLMFIFGGFTWMTSSGNPEKVKKGRDTILWSAMGLLTIFSAYGLTRFILSNIVK